MNRAYSMIEVKSLDEKRRIFSGWATTPEVDRVKDTINPLGAKFRNPLTLLHQHKHDQPVGTVIFGKPTANGVPFEAEIPVIAEPGPLKDRVDTAWGEIKNKIVRAVSIGFRAIKHAVKDDGGIDFQEIEIYELSTVSVPANAGAIITDIRAIKQFDIGVPDISDRSPLAALGTKEAVLARSRVGDKSVQLLSPSKAMSKTLAEQISGLEATRVAKAARLQAIMDLPISEGRSTEPHESEEFDTVEAEIVTVDKDLQRLHTLERMNGHSAKPVNGTTPEDASASRAGRISVVRTPEKLEPGIEFARYVMCVAAGRGNLMQSAEIARQNYGETSDVFGVVKALGRIGTTSNMEILNSFTAMQKAAAQAGTTTDSDWAAPLVFAFPRFAGDFVEFLRPRTIIGNVPGMTQVPFNVNIAGQTSGATAYWVGEGKAKPLTSFGTTSTNFRWSKIATISVLSEELVRFSNPSAEAMVRNELARAVIERMDIDFIDPGKAAVANVSPASITNGVVPIVSTGNDADHIRQDLQNMFAVFDNANNPLNSPVFIMSQTKARALAMERNALSQREFDTMTSAGTGGTLEGIPVVSSQYVTRFGSTGGEIVILLNAEDIWYADDGQVTVDASREASLEMLDGSLLQDASGGTGASLVSMFQTNSVAIRAERYINWLKRRSNAVVVLSQVFWGHTAVSGT